MCDCSPKKSGVALRFPPHSTKLFLDCAGKAKRDGAFPTRRSPEEEKPGTFVQVFTRTKRLAPTAPFFPAFVYPIQPALRHRQSILGLAEQLSSLFRESVERWDRP